MSLHESGSFRPELEAAEAVVGNYQKLSSAIEAEVSNLGAAILAMQEAERQNRDADIQLALGEGNAAAVAKAQKAVADSRAAVDTIGRRLEGLRGRLLDIVSGEMPRHYENLKTGLPGYGEAVEANFRAEWEEAVRAFSEVLGRRRTLERMVGRTFNLPEPQPAAVEVDGAAFRPYKAVEALRNAISKASSESRSAREGLLPGQSVTAIDPHQVYCLTRKAHGLEAGALVVEASFPRGILANLVSINWARPARDADYDSKLFRITKAERAMEQADKAAMDAEIQARNRQEAAEHNRWIERNWPKQ